MRCVPGEGTVQGNTHCRQVSIDGTGANRASCQAPSVDPHLHGADADVLIPRDTRDGDRLPDRQPRCRFRCVDS